MLSSTTGATLADASTAFWVVVLVPAVVLLAMRAVRRVGAEQVVLVVRRGAVARTRDRGWAWRVPAVERFVLLPTRRQVVPLVVRARSLEGVEVAVLADLGVTVEPMRPGEPFGEDRHDPLLVAVEIAEGVLAADVSGSTLAALGDLLHSVETNEQRWLASVDDALGPGARALDLDLLQVEAELTPGFSRLLRP